MLNFAAFRIFPPMNSDEPLRRLECFSSAADICIRDLRSDYWGPNGLQTPVRNDYYAVLWPQSDSDLNMQIDFVSHEVSRDSLFFILPRQVHRMEGDTALLGKAICFTEDFLSKSEISPSFIAGLKIFSNQLQNEALRVDSSRVEKLSFYLEEMSSALEDRGDFSVLSLGALLKLFLIECTGMCDADVDLGASGPLLLLKRFKDCVERSFQQEHSVSHYAEALAVSPGYLNEVVKKHSGYTPKQYIQKRIVLEAKRMLRFSDIRVNELASALGFDDPQYFSRCFKQETGLTVTQFSRQS